MSSENAGSSQPFDLEKLRELIALMEEHGLTEIDLRRQDERWKLCRGPAQVMQMIPAAGFSAHGMAMAPPAPSAAGHAATPAPAADDKDRVAVKSPTVGTYYEGPSPRDAP